MPKSQILCCLGCHFGHPKNRNFFSKSQKIDFDPIDSVSMGFFKKLKTPKYGGDFLLSNLRKISFAPINSGLRAGGPKMTAWPVREKFANIRGGGAV